MAAATAEEIGEAGVAVGVAAARWRGVGSDAGGGAGRKMAGRRRESRRRCALGGASAASESPPLHLYQRLPKCCITSHRCSTLRAGYPADLHGQKRRDEGGVPREEPAATRRNRRPVPESAMGLILLHLPIMGRLIYQVKTGSTFFAC
uniref:Uncharacterized protein n=1 Tax=Oryza glaberrima TaxID=4538 RepID=I1PL20_ORYGL